jgi:hypothetical protein
LHGAPELALADMAVRHAWVFDTARGVVAAPAEKQQLDAHPLVQRLERADAVGRDEVRHEGDGLHPSASS